MQFTRHLACLASILVGAGAAHAGAFSMEGSSPSALGNAFAGSATGSHDNSDMFFNPATLRNFKATQIHLGHTSVDTRIDATVQSSTFADNVPRAGQAQAAGGRTTSAPSLYLSTPINADWSFGASLTSPLKIRTTFPEGWLGRFHALDTDINTLNATAQLAYQVNDAIALGFGLQYEHMTATVSRNTSPTTYGVYDGKAHQHGITLGVLAQPTPELKLGLGYRSARRYSLEGDVNLTSLTTGTLTTVPGRVNWTMPEIVTLGGAYQASPKLEWVGDVRWTRWSRVSTFRIELIRPAGGSIEVPLPFQDSVLTSVGMNYRLNGQWLLRAGLAHEKDAITDDMRNPRIPYGDRSWASVGVQYKVNDHASVNLAYTRQFIKNTRSQFAADASKNAASLDASYKLSSDLLGASFVYVW
jgi:long-chain fatty acid transport protein